MKKIIKLFIFAALLSAFQSCKVTKTNIWKSKNNQIVLSYDNNWQLVSPKLNKEHGSVVRLNNRSSNSSIVFISEDITEVMPSSSSIETLKYLNLVFHQNNELVVEDEITFKNARYKRTIFYLTTKQGEITNTIYTRTHGNRVTTIQFTYPKASNSQPTTVIPPAIAAVLQAMTVN